MRKCPRCAAEVPSVSSVCPRCGLAVSKMDKFIERMGNVEFGEQNNSAYSATATKEEIKAGKKESRREEKQERKRLKKEAKKEKKLARSKSDVDFTVYALNNKNGVRGSKSYQNNFSGRYQKSKDSKKYPEFTIDNATGEFNIDTSDVEIVGEKTGRMIEAQHESYSVKKARGDYAPPRIKWWELYKLADRYFARRKIKKQINSAAKIKPSFISKPVLLALSVLFGWCGAHNFYAKNYKKGVFSLFSFVISFGVILLSSFSDFFASIQVSVGGFFGFLFFFVWITDTINIIFNNFKYRLNKEAFIEKLNFNTRAKLGERYYDLEYYKKPMIYRFFCWCKRRKRDFDEYRRERRQYKIDKQKRKIEKQKQKAEEESEFEKADKMQTNSNNENTGNGEIKISDEMLSELASFGDSDEVTKPSKKKNLKNDEVENEPKKDFNEKHKKQAKIKVNSKNKRK